MTVFAVPRDLPSDNLKPNCSTGDECAKRWEVWAVNDKDEPLRGQAKLETWTFGGVVADAGPAT